MLYVMLVDKNGEPLRAKEGLIVDAVATVTQGSDKQCAEEGLATGIVEVELDTDKANADALSKNTISPQESSPDRKNSPEFGLG